MSKEELRHCPKCGGAAKVHYEEPYTWVACKKCHLSSAMYPDYGTARDPASREMAIEDWNTLEVR